MFLGIDLMEVATLLPALIAAGIIAGILAGLLGIGGGVILVPVLFQLFTILGVNPDLIMHIAVGTSLAIIVPTSIRSLKGHMDKEAVDMPLLKTWIAPVLLGAIIGALLSKVVDGSVLKGVFSVVAILVGAKLLVGRDDWVLAKDIPFGLPNFSFSTLFGTLSTLMGIGGGTFGVTYMTLCSRPIHQAIATSSGLGVLISIPATLGYIWSGWGLEGLPALSLGYVNLLGVAIMIPATILAAPWGVKIAHMFNRRKLEVIFALLLFSVAIRFIWSELG